MISFCAKWLNGPSVTRALPDYAFYKKDQKDDRELITELWNLFNQADIIIGHNGDRFDIRKTNTRFIEHGLTPPEPYKTVDTLKVAKKYFAFSSNKLDDLGNRLGVGRKIKTGGFDLWLACLNNDPKAWASMKKYNKQDVLLLERIYLKLRPWITTHPHFSERLECTNCTSTNIQKRGKRVNKGGKFAQYQCQDCGSWFRSKLTLQT